MEETHTQMTTRQLDTMLAEAHRRGALEALQPLVDELKALILTGTSAPMAMKVIVGKIRELYTRYEEKTEKP